MIGVSVISLVVCCLLAWWQWGRYSSAGGTWQNLGYVLQWPLFGLFPAFVFLRMRRLRQQAELAEEEPVPSAGAEPPAPKAPKPAAERAPVADTDDELAAYNRYLAELHARDERAG